MLAAVATSAAVTPCIEMPFAGPRSHDARLAVNFSGADTQIETGDVAAAEGRLEVIQVAVADVITCQRECTGEGMGAAGRQGAGEDDNGSVSSIAEFRLPLVGDAPTRVPTYTKPVVGARQQQFAVAHLSARFWFRWRGW